MNKTAAKAGVTQAAQNPNFLLMVEGAVTTPLALSLADLRAMPQHQATLPIACVDGWSAVATWRGIPVRDLLQAAGAREGASASVVSLQPAGSAYRGSELNPAQAADPDTLLALELNGEPLDIDHGFPVRLIGPNRPGVQQTKWVCRVVVS